MITMRSLPPGAMGPAPHHDPHRHERDERSPRRIRTALGRLRSVVAARRRPTVAPATGAATSTLAD